MIRRAVRRPLSTFTVVGVVVALGAFSLLRLPVSLLPRLDRPSVRITLDAPLLPQERLLEGWVEPLEPRLLSIVGATSVRTLLRDGGAVLHLASDWFVDPDRLYVEVERRLAELGHDPAVEYAVDLQPADRSPIVEVAVAGGDTAASRTAFVEELLVPELSSLEGAARVEVVGRGALQVVVRPRAAELAARELTPADLVERLRSVGVPYPVGKVRRGATVHDLVIEQRVGSLDELRRLPLAEAFGPRLGDVAEVDLETVSPGSFVELDGDPAVLVRVYRAPGANGVALARRVRDRVAELGAFGRQFRLEMVHDRSAEVVAAVELLGLAALVGLLAGTLVLRWMLGAWRHALSLAVIVPAGIVASFNAFHLFDVSLNLISLSGLGLALGLLVDSAIVVMESIESARAAGEPDAPVEGTRRVAGAVVAGFLTTAVVFLPLVYLTGLARAFFGVQAFVLVVSLLFALLLSLTLTPVLSRRVRAAADRPVPGLAAYRRWLRRAVARPGLVSLAATAAVLAGLAVLVRLPRELMPAAPGADVQVVYRLPDDLVDEVQEARGRSLAEAVAAAAAPFRPLQTLAAQAPVDPLAEPDRPTGEVTLRFAGPAVARAALARLREVPFDVPGLAADVALRPSALLEVARTAGGRYELVATADTPETARRLQARLASRLEATPGLGRISTPSSRDATRLLLNPAPSVGDGADPAELRRQVAYGLGEVAAGRVDIRGVEPTILVRPTLAARLELLPVAGEDAGRVVPLGARATVGETRRPEVLEREDGRWSARVLVERTQAGALTDLQALVDGLPLGPSESVRLGGEAWELGRSFRQLTLLLALSMVLVFLTVTALYESTTVSLVVMATVPVGIAGAAFLLAVTGQTLNVMSFLGLVLLAGIVVNNSIVLIHRARQLEAEPAPPDARDAGEAVVTAAAERYRPILITTLTTLAGMLPLAVFGGEGVELRRALSLAVVGGLATATVASLVLVPSLYHAACRRRLGRPGR